MKTIMVLNDTSVENHFGCQRVMSVLNQLLSRDDVKYRYYVGEDFENDPQFEEKVSQCDVFIVNGEGTIHHDRIFALKLIGVAKQIKSIKPSAKVSLINCTIQSMNKNSLNKLSYFDYVYVREGYSFEYIKSYYPSVKLVPDLSFYFNSENTNFKINHRVESHLSITSSVDVSKTIKLKVAAVSKSYNFIKIHYEGDVYKPNFTYGDLDMSTRKRVLKLINIKYASKVIYWRSCEIINRLLNKFLISVEASNHLDFQELIANQKTILSGRFHATCMSLGVLTPVVSISSNSYKTEAVLSDIGLDLSKFICDLRNVSKLKLGNIEYTDSEKLLVKRYLGSAKPLIDDMINEITQ